MTYNWQQKDWPVFTYDVKAIEDSLFSFTEAVGRMDGMEEALQEDAKTEVMLAAIVAEAVKTSEIEGEYISRKDVMSAIQNQLGLHPKPKAIKDKRASGISELMLCVRGHFKKPLSEGMLFDWHRMLMSGNRSVKAGKWRSSEEPMQVVSGSLGREKIHFEAPPSHRVPDEMRTFLKWYNNTAPGGKHEIRHAALRSAIAHLYFESIHPFEDGNGRIGRAISEKALSQNIGHTILFSLSHTIEGNKKTYYAALENAQRSNEITEWTRYFIHMLLDAQKHGESQIRFVLRKARFFDEYEAQLNERQLKVIRKMLEQGPDGFEGGMNARKYISITRTSKATATRDLQDLASKGVLLVSGGGRSTSYQVNT
ncbi:MAG: Fic family protein [Bacteroidetes bacterium]|nr:Fic family protein [Bacteroidota bacterium]